MNTTILSGTFNGLKKTYRSKDGLHYFWFSFVKKGNHIDIYCTRHPPLNGQDSGASKTHLFPSGKICLIGGREPRSQWRAESLAKQWAEYFLEYRRTGRPQN